MRNRRSVYDRLLVLSLLLTPILSCPSAYTAALSCVELQAILDKGGSVWVTSDPVTITNTLIIRSNIVLDGGGLVLDGSRRLRIMTILPGVVCQLRGVQFVNGFSSDG